MQIQYRQNGYSSGGSHRQYYPISFPIPVGSLEYTVRNVFLRAFNPQSSQARVIETSTCIEFTDECSGDLGSSTQTNVSIQEAVYSSWFPQCNVPQYNYSFFTCLGTEMSTQRRLPSLMKHVNAPQSRECDLHVATFPSSVSTNHRGV